MHNDINQFPNYFINQFHSISFAIEVKKFDLNIMSIINPFDNFIDSVWDILLLTFLI